jgi:hypothetical protein
MVNQNETGKVLKKKIPVDIPPRQTKRGGGRFFPRWMIILYYFRRSTPIESFGNSSRKAIEANNRKILSSQVLLSMNVNINSDLGDVATYWELD